MQLDLVQLMLFATRSCFLVLIWPWPRSMSPGVSGNQRNGWTKKKVGSEEDKAKWEMSSSAVCCFSRAPMGEDTEIRRRSVRIFWGRISSFGSNSPTSCKELVWTWLYFKKKKKKRLCSLSMSVTSPKIATASCWFLITSNYTTHIWVKYSVLSLLEQVFVPALSPFPCQRH